ncbi:MAG: BTAD domain-containing putative transcriptional regulator [Chloroflexota bacterium]
MVLAPGWIMLNPDCSWQIDLDRFEQLVQTAGDDLRLLQEAAELAVGEVLAEDRYEDWATPVREQVFRQWRGICLRLARLQRVAGSRGEAVGWLERVLDRDPLDEEALQALLGALGEAGLGSEALRRYQQFAQRLGEELGAEPDTDTVALADQINRGVQDVTVEHALLIAPRRHLPEPPTPFVGREQEAAMMVDRLRRSEFRLLTLTGTGGIGKTRLALKVVSQVLDDYIGGGYFVPLASVGDAALLPSALAGALGVQEVGAATLLHTIVQYLRDKQVLLLIDNYEHLLDAVTVLTEILNGCPRVKILVTSRAILHLSHEHVFEVPSLALPDPHHLPSAAALAEYDAIALFVGRGQAVDAAFVLTDENAAAVAEICRRLDGLPLAIELAAAWIRLFPPQALLQRLGDQKGCSLELLTGGAKDQPTRQQTLRNTIDWSYSLLSHEEQTLLARLSVFVGGCTFEAAHAVCNQEGELDLLEGMASLVDKSLVRQEGDDEPRFSMLETIREYAWEKLAGRAEVEELRGRHAEHYGAMVKSAEPHIKRKHEEDWFDRFDHDRENIRAAIAWHRAHRPAAAVLLGYVVHQYWIMHAELGELIRWVEDVHVHNALLPSAQRVKFLDMAVAIADKAKHPRAEELFEQSVTLRHELGDVTGKRDALERAAQRLLRQGDPLAALRLFEESLQLQRAHGTTDRIHYEQDTLPRVMQVAQIVGDYDRATAVARESLTLARGRKNTHDIARWQTFLGWLALLQADYSQAGELLQQGLSVQRALSDKDCMPTSLVNLAILALERGDPQAADEFLQEGLVYLRELQQTHRVAEHLAVLGRAALMRGDLEQATRHCHEGLALAGQADDRRSKAEAIWGLAALATAHQDWQGAMRLARLASALQEQAGYHPAPIEEVRYEQIRAGARSHLGDGALDST